MGESRDATQPADDAETCQIQLRTVAVLTGAQHREDLDLRSLLPQAGEDLPQRSQPKARDWWVRASPVMLQLALRLIVQPLGSVEGHRLTGARHEGRWLVLSFGGASDPHEHARREWADAFKLTICLARVLIEGQDGFLREEWVGAEHRLTVGLRVTARLSRLEPAAATAGGQRPQGLAGVLVPSLPGQTCGGSCPRAW